MLQITNSVQPNRGSKARGAEPLTWFRKHADMTHEQPGPLRTPRHAPFYRVEFGIPALTDRDTEITIQYPKDTRTRSTYEQCSCYRPGKVLRGAKHRDACANLTAIKALRGSPEGRDQGLLYLEKRPLDTWYLRLLAVRPMDIKQKQ